MRTFVRPGLAALASLATFYLSLQLLLPRALALLPQQFYAVIPVEPFALNLWLSALLAGICLAMLASRQRLAGIGLFAASLAGIILVTFGLSLCSAAEIQRIETALANMPSYNLGQTPHEPISIEPAATTVSYQCVLPDERVSSMLSIAGDYSSSLLGLTLGCLLVPRRLRRQQAQPA